MSKSKFVRTLPESKKIFALEQKVIVLSFVKIVAFLLGNPVDDMNLCFSIRDTQIYTKPMNLKIQRNIERE